MLPHTSGVVFAVISPRSSENQNSAVSLLMHGRHALYKIQRCLQGVEILIFLFVSQKTNSFGSSLFLQEKGESVVIRHSSLKAASMALCVE